ISWDGSEEVATPLAGLTGSCHTGDTSSATLSPYPTLFRSRDGTLALSNGQGFAASDLGHLVVSAPDLGGESALLTLTVSSSEGGSTTSAVELLSVTASAVAEPPVFGTTKSWSGSEEGTIRL